MSDRRRLTSDCNASLTAPSTTRTLSRLSATPRLSEPPSISLVLRRRKYTERPATPSQPRHNVERAGAQGRKGLHQGSRQGDSRGREARICMFPDPAMRAKLTVAAEQPPSGHREATSVGEADPPGMATLLEYPRPVLLTPRRPQILPRPRGSS